MYLAFCDDSLQDGKQIAAVVEAFAASHAPHVQFEWFSDPETMLHSAHERRFTHYLLDVVMPTMDGITAAQEIRSFDTDAKLIFLTSSKEFAYESYRVRAHDYLLKPVDPSALSTLLGQLLAQEKANKECLLLHSGAVLFRLPFADISHVEVYQKKLHYHLTDGQIRQMPGSIAEAEKNLCSRPEFVKIHRSYIVNLHHISALSPDGCLMISGDNLPVSRLLFHQVQQRFMAQLFAGEEE